MSSLAATVWPSPAARTRVLIADDSVVIRGLVARWLEESGHFEVVATVSNGRAAVEAAGRTEPDVVVLDIDMPELDGINALPLILQKRPQARVVMFSTLTQRNAEISLRCLSLGAIDYLPKPESNRQVTTSPTFRNELVEKLKALGPRRAASRWPFPGRAEPSLAEPPAPREMRLAPRPRAFAGGPPRALLVGASTGGPRAVMQVLAAMAPSLKRVPTLIVQHMPPVFTAVFAEHLTAQVGVKAAEAVDGEALAPGRIYVAPGGRHMGLAGDRARPTVRLDDGPLVNFCRPAVDVLFRDAAQVLGGTAAAVVLTGMGSDGTVGAKALVEAGCGVIVQDEATSTVWGMPGSIARAGLAREILPLDAIAPALAGLFAGAGA